MSSRKPFFSRQQLNWLIIILIGVIALLSLAPSPVSWPTLQRQALGNAMLLHPAEPSSHPASLRLSLMLPPYLVTNDPLSIQLQTLLLEQLPPELQTNLQLQRLADRIRLTLPLNDQHRITALFTTLAQRPSAERLAIAERQLTAARNLIRSEEDRNLWARKDTAHLPLADLYDNWLSQQQLVLVTTQPPAKDSQLALSQGVALLAGGQPWGITPPALPDNATRPSADLQQSQLRLLRSLPGRNDPEFDAKRLTLLWLRPLATNSGIQLEWQAHSGQSRLLLSALGENAEGLLHKLRLAVSTNSDDIETFRDALNERLQQQLESPLGYLDLLDTIAAYQLPLDALPRFAATIAALKADTLRQQALDLLDPAAFRTIRLIPLTPEPIPHASSIQPSRAQ